MLAVRVVAEDSKRQRIKSEGSKTVAHGLWRDINEGGL